ncbi:MAG TPA: PEGA domain-containing protein, partial [Polyangiaceae bacterium]
RFSGPVTVELSCSTASDGATCFPTQGGPEGSYSLRVVAPGFGPLTTNVTVTYTPSVGCGCGGATLEPSTVTVNPVRL